MQFKLPKLKSPSHAAMAMAEIATATSATPMVASRPAPCRSRTLGMRSPTTSWGRWTHLGIREFFYMGYCYQKGDVRIRYEETGSGFPLLVTPGGGLNFDVV
jgi:hypothetical protein